MLSVELGEANGEGEEMKGTPYVRPIALAGGMCAQAVCFMATALLHEHAVSVHSIPDITALATVKGDHPRAVTLHGLDQCELVEYFKEAGLRAICQTAGWYHYQEGPVLQRQFPLREEPNAFVTIVRSYLLSEMPVIATVDAGRLAGVTAEGFDTSSAKSIYDRNGLKKGKYLSDPDELRERNHAICIVGCGMAADNQRDFYFNDPMALPFMVASAEQLAHASCYVRKTNLTERYVPLFLPVTPSRVRLPLGDWWPTCTDRERSKKLANLGLLRIAQYWQTDRNEQLPVFPTPYEPGEFRLCQIGDIPGAGLVGAIAGRSVVTDWCTQAGRSDMLGKDHWCWIQYSPDATWGNEVVHSLWIWDAEMEPPTIEDWEEPLLKRYLLAVFAGNPASPELQMIEDHLQEAVCRMPQETKEPKTLPENPDGHELQAVKNDPPEAVGQMLLEKPEPSDAPEPDPSATESKDAEQLRQSIITSFSTSGIDTSLASWPEGVNFCDLYAFMAADEEQLESYLISGHKWRQLLRYTVRATVDNLFRWIPVQFRTGGRFFRISLRCRKQLGVPWPIVDAGERMAMLSSGGRAARRYARRAHDAVSRKSGGPQILAIASFVPGLAAEDESGKKACKAVEFLISLAQELQALGHPCHTVEIVAGSLFEGTWEGIKTGPGVNPKKRRIYLANVQSRDKALECLCDNLRTLNVCCDKYPERPVQLAIELEPGPFFVVNRWDSLEKLCRQMEGRPAFSRVGLNLDIAHWSLSQITPQMVRGSDMVRKRVVHSHISDHGNGHFADVALGRIHKDAAHLREWVCLLDAISREPRMPGYPQYLGGVAIELEACRTRDLLVESVRMLAAMVDGRNEPAANGNVPSTGQIDIRSYPGKGKGESDSRKKLDDMQDLDIQEDKQ